MTEPSGRLTGRRIALGVTGSIAAYKAVELLRMLQAEGADVRVLMTTAATAFIGQLTLETLSRHPVDHDVLALQADGRIGHISAAHDVEAIVVAPATAHWLAAMANGLAGDSVTAACLATDVPVVVAPAMDGGMYAHPATQANVARLREFGYRIVEPQEGPLASGMVGRGRLADLPAIVGAVVEALAGMPAGAPSGTAASAAPGFPPEAEAAAILPPVAPTPSRHDFSGRHVVVTAGGTAEPIDPVRFIGNRSTGKMGVAIAADALDRGAAVTLILGLSTVAPPAGAHVARVETAADMQAALRALTPPEGPVFDVLVMAAAVADFRPKVASTKKLARGSASKLDLDPTPDLLAEASERVTAGARASGGLRPVMVGFAAETGSTDRAAEKVAFKGVDMLVANDVTEPGAGFGTDTNHVTIYYPDRAPEELPMLPKSEVAELILDRTLIRLDARVPLEEAQPSAGPAQEAEPAATETEP
jgi:phosphopantothenoylcysteine decarboxylase/phosphopantothenate--cysteine ligase